MRFIRRNKKSISKEGIIYMYRTSLGIKAINYVGDRFKKTLQALRYPIILLGIILMGTMLWMLGRTLSIYILHPEITEVIKAPPIAPLIPYFPKLFGLSSLFPPFYFTYFIVALAVVAIVHEFSHGIFMRRFKIKIKSTGLVFLGPILGAFVEEGKSSFEKKKKVDQMTVLGAGVFANTLFALIFYGLYVLFFISAFSPAGYIFSSYSMEVIPTSNIIGLEDDGNLKRVITLDGEYFIDETLAKQLEVEGLDTLVVYEDAPAVKSQLPLGTAITQIDNAPIRTVSDLQSFLSEKNPGETIVITTFNGDQEETTTLTLAEHPEIAGKSYVGIGHKNQEPVGAIQKFFAVFMSFKEPATYYKPSFDEDTATFFLHFLWWIMIINLLVALFNMLPLGMLDGGKFFYLLIAGITRSEKAGAWAYKWMGRLIIAAFIIMMLYWAFNVF